MIDCTEDPTDYSAEWIARRLSGTQLLKTPLKQRPDRDVSAAGNVILWPGDHECAHCGSEIGEFGGAPALLILARMKRDRGETYCAACHRTDSAREVEA